MSTLKVNRIEPRTGTSVTIGEDAGLTNQGVYTVAVGVDTGKTNQQNYAVALGYYAGEVDQGNSSIAVGNYAGKTNQSSHAVAIGPNAGSTNQGGSAIAVGQSAGQTTQGESSVAIGYGAGNTSQANNGIIISSRGTACNDPNPKHIAITTDVSNGLYYNGTNTWTFSGGSVNGINGFRQNGVPVIDAKGLINTLSTLRQATMDETTLEGLRDSIGNAIGGLIENLEHDISTMPAPEEVVSMEEVKSFIKIEE